MPPGSMKETGDSSNGNQICSMASESCTFCEIIKDGKLLLYKDDKCCIFLDRQQRAKEYFQCVPLRHIRDIHHLRPSIHTKIEAKSKNKEDILPIQYDLVAKSNKESKVGPNDLIVSNEQDPMADIELVKHMCQVSIKYMKQRVPDNEYGYNIGFHRPPLNTQYHLHLHMIILPFKNTRHEITHGQWLTKPETLIKSL